MKNRTTDDEGDKKITSEEKKEKGDTEGAQTRREVKR